MKRTLRNLGLFGISAVLVASLLGSVAWAQHGGYGGHSNFGGHGYGGHSSYGSHSILAGHGYSGHSSYGIPFNSGWHGHGGVGLGFHVSSDYSHHSYYPRYYGHHSYYGSYPYYGDYSLDTSFPNYRYAISEPVVVSRPMTKDASIPNVAASPIKSECAVASASVSDVSAVNSYSQSAKNAFRAGQFDEAARLANHALVEDSSNINLHLLLSHALFAASDYRGATMAVHRAAAIGGTEKLGYYVKNWRILYRNSSYIDAMNRLNRFVNEKPDDVAARFLRGYHFMYLGDHTDYAARELAKAIKLEPNDRLAANLLATISDIDDVTKPIGRKEIEPESQPANSDRHKHEKDEW